MASQEKTYPHVETKKGIRGPKKRKSKKGKVFPAKIRAGKTMDEDIRILKDMCAEFDSTTVDQFSDYPISEKTKKGLSQAGYKVPTGIQKESIILALQGNDILGAAKTGSGKTLAFLIPILESLYKLKWSSIDGLGALIISPTRELAYQTFEVLRKIGKLHSFSAGLVIGGKDLKHEAERMARTNIVICTPGRLLQHMDETVFFTADNLQMLVLDEADRILDMGFQDTMNAIIENLPPKRQTLLFSATQTKSIKDLARLSLKDPTYVSVHEHAKHSTPTQLQQSYMVCELHQKLDLLWSFIKNHLKTKILVFMQSCKQVRFVYESFKKLRPGMTVLALHGAMTQVKRVMAYDSFCRKEHAVLFATDIAARGLDFPAVSWVVQLDCPEDANTYIHRAGRTARYEKDGEALLILLESEQAMIDHLLQRKIPITQIKVNPKRLLTIEGKLQSLCASEVQIKEFAQRAFVSYIKSVFLMKDKSVFLVKKLDTEAYSKSMGLAIPPRIRFLQKHDKQSKKKQDTEEAMGSSETNDETGQKLERTNDTESESDSKDSSNDDDDNSGLRKGEKIAGFGAEDDDDDDLFTVKRKLHVTDTTEDDKEILEALGSAETLSKAALAKKLAKKNIKVNKKVVFDDEGEVIHNPLKEDGEEESDEEEVTGINLEAAKQRMKEVDRVDRQLERSKIKKRKLESKQKLKEQMRKAKEEHDSKEEGGAAVATLGSEDDDQSDSDEESPASKKPRVTDDDDSEEEMDDQSSGSDTESSDSDKDNVQMAQVMSRNKHGADMTLEDEEALALKLLSG